MSKLFLEQQDTFEQHGSLGTRTPLLASNIKPPPSHCRPQSAAMWARLSYQPQYLTVWSTPEHEPHAKSETHV